ncbi:9866_t:CDS:1 [Entrophospora sp. SA101]|nr:9866_t:CDS:1 [Entrophospora sp. SA101]
MKKNNKELEKILQEAENPKNIGQGAWDLPANPTPVEEIKFNLCQEILGYKLTNNLTREQVAERIQLNKNKTEDILFCRLNKFSLDSLTNAASKLFAPDRIKIVVEVNKTHARTI